MDQAFVLMSWTPTTVCVLKVIVLYCASRYLFDTFYSVCVGLHSTYFRT